MTKPILCLDFDGVIHSYDSPWQGAETIPDPPVPGALRFLTEATEHFRVVIFSTRSAGWEGRAAMRKWLYHHLVKNDMSGQILAEIEFPTEKPAAFITIDDRALTFDGTWPDIETLRKFKPWNKK